MSEEKSDEREFADLGEEGVDKFLVMLDGARIGNSLCGQTLLAEVAPSASSSVLGDLELAAAVGEGRGQRNSANEEATVRTNVLLVGSNPFVCSRLWWRCESERTSSGGGRTSVPAPS